MRVPSLKYLLNVQVFSVLIKNILGFGAKESVFDASSS